MAGPHTLDRWAAPRRAQTGLLVGVVALLGLSACDGEEPEAKTASMDAEEAAYQADLDFFEARKEAYERSGLVPSVPSDLSDRPHDPEFVFDGYMAVEPSSPGLRKKEPSDEPEAPPSAEEALDHPEDIAGVIVSPNGERWLWKPSDLEARLDARRLARGGDSTERSVDASEVSAEVEADLRFRTIIGSDGRTLRSNYTGHSMTGVPWRWIGALVRDGEGPGANTPPFPQCTAAKYGERHLLTAAHCVFDAAGGESSLRRVDWIPGADGVGWSMTGSDSTPNGYKHIKWYYYPTKFVSDGWWTRDYAVLVLYDNENSCSFGGFGYRNDSSLNGEDVWNFGFPSEQNECADSPFGVCFGSAYGMEKNIYSTTASYAYTKHDVQKGHSGGPMYDWNGGSRQILALASKESVTSTRSVRLRSRVFDFMEAARDIYDSDHCSY